MSASIPVPPAAKGRPPGRSVGRPRPLRRCCWLLLALLLPPGAAEATNSFRWTTNYYTVTGTNLAEIHVSMNQARPWKGPENYAGLTDWRIHWQYHTAPAAGRCRWVSFTTQTTITTTLPRWTPPPGASEDLKRDWERFITALGEHEVGHARLALAALADVHRRVKALGEEADCAELNRRIDATARRVLDEHRQRDLEYDRRTNHGANQGAALRGRIR